MLILILQTCNLNSNQNKTMIEIEGKALNLKLGAVVHDKNGNNYFIDKLSYWETNIIGKDIIVKGYLIEIEHKQVNNNKDLISQKVGDGNWTQKIIKKAKWHLK